MLFECFHALFAQGRMREECDEKGAKASECVCGRWVSLTHSATHSLTYSLTHHYFTTILLNDEEVEKNYCEERAR